MRTCEVGYALQEITNTYVKIQECEEGQRYVAEVNECILSSDESEDNEDNNNQDRQR